MKELGIFEKWQDNTDARTEGFGYRGKIVTALREEI